MNAKKRRRLAFVLAVVVAGIGGAGLVITALGNNIRYFYSPSDLAVDHVKPGMAIRLGGLVQAKSVRHDSGVEVHFVITDGNHAVPVAYTGGLPGLFREEQGIVALGALNQNGVFVATELLAKHDERYMPPEVEDALKRSGHWREGS